VVELSQKTWLVGGIIPGFNRHPEKKIAPNEQALLRPLHRRRDQLPPLVPLLFEVLAGSGTETR
jgi:hypothetical protein